MKIRTRFIQWATYLLIILIPTSIYWPLAQPLATDVVPMYVTPGVYLTDLLIVGLLLASLSQGYPRRPKLSRLTWPLIVIVGLGILTAPFAISPALAGYTALRWVLALGLYLVLTRAKISVEQAALVFVLGMSIHALVGAGQFWRHGPLGIPGEMALDVNQRGSAFISAGGVRWLRVYGMTFHPNVLGGFLTVGLILGLPLLVRKWVRALWWLLCLGLLLTFSRSAWIAAGIVVPIVAGWLVWRQPALRRPLGITLGVVALSGFVGVMLLWGQIKTRLLPTQTKSELASLSGRGELIALAIDTILHRPLTGAGAGNFPLLVIETKTPTFAHYVHNVPLLLAAEVGVMAGLLWYWLWLYPVGRLDRIWRRTDPWPIALIGAWFALGFISLWDSYPWALESGRLLSILLLAWINQRD